MDQTTQDLDKQRDERCIPVAMGVLNDMALDLIPPDPAQPIDAGQIAKLRLERERDADLNITTDVPYISQLVLKGLARLNGTAQRATTEPIDDARYYRIADATLDILSTSGIDLLATPDKEETDSAALLERLNTLFATEKLSVLELKYVMDLIFEAYQQVQSMHDMSLEDSSMRAEAKLFGIANMADLTMGKLDTVLKEAGPISDRDAA